LLTVKWFKNQIHELNEKLNIAIEGWLQFVKLNKNNVVLNQTYLIINKTLEKNNSIQ
jgi:hypothetical protein